ncbi:TetR/AcrR family transcriptional regulator [Oscillatoriales cyanobacterium LEGE 11467]|uniref:TetR/AcrR family transcriptional regulator n=1 Tax=Zarconia navalis LEGE 11467 TaxID=1828826 RepID=A0A928VX21_9CYAN|nr:TetR/AcrR family transcriptional regulator [Zarconia navalis]MBE9039240.1 TetR/AcrR family transcriptional regulator [Zarconia navalis LEGE 11467]
MSVPADKQTQWKSKVATAALELISREGLQGASLRAIAHELGCTTGVLTHYFRNKDELLLFVLETVMERLSETLAQAAQGTQGVERLKVMMLAILPTTPELVTIWRAWLAFVGAALGHAALLDEHKRHYANFKAFIHQELVMLQEAGEIDPKLNLDFEAAAWIATFDGIGVNTISAPQSYSPEELDTLVSRYLKTLTS